MKNIITISRQFGAGGGTIGKEVAERLGYYYCDKDMIIRAAIESSNLSPDEVRYFDERYQESLAWDRVYLTSTTSHLMSVFTMLKKKQYEKSPKKATA